MVFFRGNVHALLCFLQNTIHFYLDFIYIRFEPVFDPSGNQILIGTMPIVGLNSLRRKDDDDDDKKKGNEYFAGGLGSHGGGRYLL